VRLGQMPCGARGDRRSTDAAADPIMMMSLPVLAPCCSTLPVRMPLAVRVTSELTKGLKKYSTTPTLLSSR